MRLLSLILFALLFCNFPAKANDAEEDIYAAFEWFCLSHLKEPDTIPILLKDSPFVELPKDIAEKFLAPQSGRAWMHDEKHKTVLALTDKNICSIMNTGSDGSAILKFFLDFTNNIKLDTINMGSQFQDVYAVTFPDAKGKGDGHAIVMITLSKLPSYKGIIMNSMSENTAKEIGINYNKWP